MAGRPATASAGPGSFLPRHHRKSQPSSRCPVVPATAGTTGHREKPALRWQVPQAPRATRGSPSTSRRRLKTGIGPGTPPGQPIAPRGPKRIPVAAVWPASASPMRPGGPRGTSALPPAPQPHPVAAGWPIGTFPLWPCGPQGHLRCSLVAHRHRSNVPVGHRDRTVRALWATGPERRPATCLRAGRWGSSPAKRGDSRGGNGRGTHRSHHVLPARLEGRFQGGSPA
jgi:hypothetical protein